MINNTMESLYGGSLLVFAKTLSIKITSVYNLHEIIEVIRFILKERIMNVRFVLLKHGSIYLYRE